jgi:hypothetical protein
MDGLMTTANVQVRVTIHWAKATDGQPNLNRYDISLPDLLGELAAIRQRVEVGDVRKAEVRILVLDGEEANPNTSGGGHP